MQASDDLNADRAIARDLRRTWPAFFERFGRLTDIQRQAIPPILEGHNTLVCSRTASGKTEAVCAPLVERHVDRKQPWTILYVSPTRALVNDLFERLDRPLSSMPLRLARRTGDHRQGLAPQPNVLLTTPESFDSMLCRGRTSDGHLLAPVVAVVLDEIHLLHSTPRGEQIRWLLSRLTRLREFATREGWIAEPTVQVVALSATVPDAPKVGATYLGPDAHIVTVHGGRPIEIVPVQARTPSVEDALPAYLKQETKDRKILVFSNARRRVDTLAAKLRRDLNSLGYEVRAHHGSLSQRLREQAEADMKSESKLVLFCTSTLELGIDIGDIDLVVLDSPAPSITSLLQRIGRGNRRTDVTRVMPCSGSLAEVIVNTAMIWSAQQGQFGPVEEGPSHAVARQQIASYIFQGPKRARSRRSLDELLNQCAEPIVQAELIDHLVEHGEFIEEESHVRLSDTWRDRAEGGDIHGNIEGSIGTSVVDQATGQEIARNIDFAAGDALTVGGQLMEVKGWQARKLEVRKATQQIPEGVWSYRSQSWMKGAGQPDAVRRYLEIEDGEWPMIEDSGTIVFHFGGGRRRAVLELLIEHASERQITVNEWFITFPRRQIEKPAWIGAANSGLVEMQIRDHIDRLERRLARPFANRQLPDSVRTDELQQWLQVDNEVAAIKSARWHTPIDPDITQTLRTLRHEMRGSRR